MATERRPSRPSTTRMPQQPAPQRPPTSKVPMRDLPPHEIKLSTPAPAPPPQKTSTRPITRSMPRGQAPRTSRSEAQSTRSFAAPKKSNLPLILGGVGGGVLLLVIIVAAATSGGSRKPPPASNPKPGAGRPVDVSGLETTGMRKCDEGLVIIQRCDPLMRKADLTTGEKSQLRTELVRGKALLDEGMGMLDEANQKTNYQNKYDTSKYGQTLKLVRGKLLEIGN
jgi:hypothetical protein